MAEKIKQRYEGDTLVFFEEEGASRTTTGHPILSISPTMVQIGSADSDIDVKILAGSGSKYFTFNAGDSDFTPSTGAETDSLIIGSCATGIDFTGTYTGNAIDFSSATIAPTGSNGPCFIRAGTYASPIDLGTDTDQSGMIRLYSTSSATTASGYDRGIFVCCQTTVTKSIHPVAGLAEVRNTSGNGPIAVGAAQFISHLFLSTSKVDARGTAGTANFYGAWLKVTSVTSSEAKSGSVVAPVWLDNQMNGTVTGEEYAAYITSGTLVDAVFGFEGTAGGRWNNFLSFDSTCYNLVPIVAADLTGSTKKYLKVDLNGTAYGIHLWSVA